MDGLSSFCAKYRKSAVEISKWHAFNTDKPERFLELIYKVSVVQSSTVVKNMQKPETIIKETDLPQKMFRFQP